MSQHKPEDILWEGKLPEREETFRIIRGPRDVWKKPPALVLMQKTPEDWSTDFGAKYHHCYSGICAEVYMTAFLEAKEECERLDNIILEMGELEE